ncbi:MAG: CHAT domain-containing protein, partial [Acidimicrobiales bacterium]
AELRQVRTQLREVALSEPASDPRAPSDPSRHRARLAARAAQLEDSVRRQNLRVNDRDGFRTGRIDMAALRAALGDRWLVEFVTSEGRLYAITVNGERTRLHRLGSGSIEDEKRYLLFAMRRLLTDPRRPGGAAALAATAARLDSMLLAPLRIPPVVPVVIVPTGTLHGLPWPALPTLSRRPATVAPSAAIWLAGARSAPDPKSTPTPDGGEAGTVALIAGPGLPAAVEEVDQLAALYGRADRLVGSAATAPAVLSALERAAVAHLAAHGTFRADSPMFSSVLLADGPLTVYDLERLRRAPDTVVVAACDAAVSAVRTGDGLLGTGAALIGLGVRSVVAPVMPVPDHATVPIMVALHRHLLAGDTPAEALANAQAGQDPAVGAALICIGCDDRPSTAGLL